MSKAIIILGSPNDDEGRLSEIARSRCNRGHELYSKDQSQFILCTGGIGVHFNRTNRPHGEHAKNYLHKMGVPKFSFLSVAESKFTIEDALLAKPILDSKGIKKIVIVTSDFHINRVKMIFSKVCSFFEITYSESTLNMTSFEFDALVAHEKEAFVRDEQFLASYKTT